MVGGPTGRGCDFRPVPGVAAQTFREPRSSYGHAGVLALLGLPREGADPAREGGTNDPAVEARFTARAPASRDHRARPGSDIWPGSDPAPRLRGSSLSGSVGAASLGGGAP